MTEGVAESRADPAERPDLSTRLRQTVGLFGAICKREAIFQYRYPVNTLGGLAVSYVFFLMIFVGGQAVGGAQFDDSLGAVIVGYFLWTMASAAYQSLANQVTSESQWGTLERLYMSPVGFGRVMTMLAVANIGFGVLWGVVTLALMLLTTGERFAIDLLTVVPIGFFAVLSAMGVGFAFGGAAVLYKQIGNVTGLVQPAFFGLAAAPAAATPLVKLLPIVQGSYLLQRSMRGGVHLWEFPTAQLGILVGVGLAYFLAGYGLFALATRRARRKGVLGHY